MAAKVPGELDERYILLMDIVENAYRTGVFAKNPDDVAAGSSKLALQGLHTLYRRFEMLFKEPLEDFHDDRILPQVRKEEARM